MIDIINPFEGNAIPANGTWAALKAAGTGEGENFATPRLYNGVAAADGLAVYNGGPYHEIIIHLADGRAIRYSEGATPVGLFPRNVKQLDLIVQNCNFRDGEYRYPHMNGIDIHGNRIQFTAMVTETVAQAVAKRDNSVITIPTPPPTVVTPPPTVVTPPPTVVTPPPTVVTPPPPVINPPKESVPPKMDNPIFNIDGTQADNIGTELADVAEVSLTPAGRAKVYSIMTKINVIAAPVYALAGGAALFFRGELGAEIATGTIALATVKSIVSAFVTKLAKNNVNK